MSIMMGRSIYGAEGLRFVTEIELPDGENSDFGFPDIDEKIVKLISIYRKRTFISGEFPMSKYDGTYTKQVEEKFVVYHDFSPDLISDELLTTISSIVAIKLSDGSDVTASIITDNVDVNGKEAFYGLIGGEDGEDYKITLSVATDESVGSVDGGIRTAEHFLTVHNR